MNKKHGGNIRRLAALAGIAPGDVLDFSASINPLGPPEWLRDEISAAVSSLSHYPDTECAELVAAIARKCGCGPSEIMPGNGSTELLYLLPQAVGAKRAVIPTPAYADYEAAAVAAGLQVLHVPMPEENSFTPSPDILAPHLRDGDLVFIGYPSNPSGTMWGASELRAVAEKHPGVFFLLDEAFLDFVDGAESFAARRPANVAVLLSFTKIYAVPGLRLGALAASEAVAEKIRERQPCWTVNSLAQAVGTRAMADAEYVERSRRYVSEMRYKLVAGLEAIPGVKVFPGRANYLLAKLESAGSDARAMADALLKRGIAIRVCDNFDGLDGRYFRVAVRGDVENDRLVESVAHYLVGREIVSSPRRTPAIMFQGTCSNAGKSILTAAMCRVLLRDGYAVAPYKSQNMALNSFVTRDGGEMGRAQVVQAQACRLEPETRMNPILLKPNSDTGSQVIVNGMPVGNMRVGEYIKYKPEAFAEAKRAYESLAAEVDVMVLEGAGSPGEVNLKRHDIVNMNMARHAGAPVLLVGDIDRGGVFASFVGTMEVLAEWERGMVAGFIVNKFRGDASLLKDALDYTLRRTGRPVMGVMPYVRDLGLPEEDSVGFKSGSYDNRRTDGGVTIAVVDLPHISNFTDVDPFLNEPDVNVVIARKASDFRGADAVIIPGSKNVMGDIGFLSANGVGEMIREMARGGTTQVVGLCAGLQMMGTEIEDPHGLESAAGRTVKGLGLLPVSSVLERDKTLERAEARHGPSGLLVRGYEIHHGRMRGSTEPCVTRSDGEVIGVRGGDGSAWGTYLHGIFDDDYFRRWFIDRLRERKGLAPVNEVLAPYDLEPALEKLADVFLEHVDIGAIYKVMGLK